MRASFKNSILFILVFFIILFIVLKLFGIIAFYSILYFCVGYLVGDGWGFARGRKNGHTEAQIEIQEEFEHKNK